MKRSRSYVALLLVYLFLPGAHEVTENVVHVVAHGDLAHFGADTDHHEPGTEHDCSGLFHTCLCHASVPVVVSADQVGLFPPPPGLDAAAGGGSDRLAAGYPDPPFRPPIA